MEFVQITGTRRQLTGRWTKDKSDFLVTHYVVRDPIDHSGISPVCLSCRWAIYCFCFVWIKNMFAGAGGGGGMWDTNTTVVVVVQTQMVRNDQYNTRHTHTHLVDKAPT
jgi:hypothetical protein